MNRNEAERKFYQAMQDHPMNREDGSCWFWPRKLSGGYGQLRVGSQVMLAHKVSYQIFKGPVPVGAALLNKCGYKKCVNPDHWQASEGKKSKIRKGDSDRRKGGGWKPGPRLKYGIEKVYRKKQALEEAFEVSEKAKEEVNERIKKQGGLK